MSTPTYADRKRRADQLRKERQLSQQRLHEIGRELTELRSTLAELAALRTPLEVAIKAGDRDPFELATLESREAELTISLNVLSTEQADLHKQINLIGAALSQLQKDNKAKFHSELWERYEDEFPKLLRQFEHITGRLLVAQLGRSGIDGDLVGVIRWLVQRGELQDPASCFRAELEKTGIFSNL
jgi:chromosome segregation ATPase